MAVEDLIMRDGFSRQAYCCPIQIMCHTYKNRNERDYIMKKDIDAYSLFSAFLKEVNLDQN